MLSSRSLQCSRIAGTPRSLRLQCRAMVQASTSQVPETQRRAILLSSVLPLALGFVSPALALIPDEEDEELIERAKANRAARIASQKKTTQEFLEAGGLKDAKADQELIPIQRAVYKLSESGSKLESGDVQGASAILSESWTSEFEVASGKVGNESSTLTARLADLKSAASKGDAQASKRAYVDLVAELQSWSEASGLSSRIKGL